MFKTCMYVRPTPCIYNVNIQSYLYCTCILTASTVIDANDLAEKLRYTNILMWKQTNIIPKTKRYVFYNFF